MATQQDAARGWQVVSRWRDRGPHAFEQRRRFWHGLDAELLTQHAPARVILGNCRLPLARVRQHKHQLAMRFLQPRLFGDQPTRRRDAAAPGAAPQAGVDLSAQRLHVLSAQLFALRKEPRVEIRRARERQACQELTPVQARRRFQVGGD